MVYLSVVSGLSVVEKMYLITSEHSGNQSCMGGTEANFPDGSDGENLSIGYWHRLFADHAGSAAF
jgi:hypothetical protein